jgi:hypothetical protein
MADADKPNILVIWGMTSGSPASSWPPSWSSRRGRKAASFTFDQALDKLETVITAHR